MSKPDLRRALHLLRPGFHGKCPPFCNYAQIKAIYEAAGQPGVDVDGNPTPPTTPTNDDPMPTEAELVTAVTDHIAQKTAEAQAERTAVEGKRARMKGIAGKLRNRTATQDERDDALAWLIRQAR